MDRLKDRKVILTLLLLGVLLLSIPFAVKLAQEQQWLKSRAVGENPIEFTGTGGSCDNQGKCAAKNNAVRVNLRSPLGPPR